MKAGNNDIRLTAEMANKLAQRQGVRMEENHGGMFRAVRTPIEDHEMFQYRKNATRSNRDLPKITNLKEHATLLQTTKVDGNDQRR